MADIAAIANGESAATIREKLNLIRVEANKVDDKSDSDHTHTGVYLAVDGQAVDVNPAGSAIGAALAAKSASNHTHTGVYQPAGSYATASHNHAGVYQTVGTYPVSSLAGLGTGVATALAINVGSAGAPVVVNGALGTPSSGTLTNVSGLPLSGLVYASAASRVLVRGSAAGAGAWQEGTLAGLVMNGTVLSGGWCWPLALAGETEALSAGQKFAMNLPFGFVATSIYASLTAAGSASAITIDLKTDGAVSILNAVLSLPAAAFYAETSTFAASASSYTLAKNARLTAHIVAADSGGTGTGLKVFVSGYRTS